MKTLRAPLPLPPRQMRLKARFLLLGFSVLSCNPLMTQDVASNKPYPIEVGTGAKSLEQAVALIRENYVDSFRYDPTRDTDLWSLFSRLDPYSGYLPAPRRERFENNIEGRGTFKFGFGPRIVDDTFRFESIDPNSTLRREGICIGDRLLDVNGVSLVHHDRAYFDSVFDRLPVGFVNFGVLRPSTGEHLRFIVSKAALPPEDHFSALMLSDSVIYIAFDGFWSGIADRVDRTIEYLMEAYPATKDVILDLRYNRGGLVTEAVSLVNLFVQSSLPVIRVRSTAHPSSDQVIYAQNPPHYGQLGLTVIVNEGSYSAAELLSGCLQDLDRATIIGQQTGGKGLVMHMFDLPGGAGAYLTIGRYYLPSGRCLQVTYDDGIQGPHQPEPEKIVYNLLHEYEQPYRCDRETFLTTTERPVYGGMGIVPDILVPDHTTDYSFGSLTGDQLYELWHSFVDHYQPIILRSDTYDDFVKRLPVSDLVLFLSPKVARLSTVPYSTDRLQALAMRIMMWLQNGYYGMLTHTRATLAEDRSVQEAAKQIAIDRTPKQPNALAVKKAKSIRVRVPLAEK